MFEFFKRKKPIAESSHVIVGLSADDPVLHACKEKAQEELPYLVNFMETHERDETLFRYAVKANFIEEGKSEHMWVQVSDFKNGCFIGRLANEPATVTLLKYGDPVKVLRDNVEDWILEDFLTHTKVGGFSQSYMRNSEN
jgi:uncharacterized protein YegJ (DUF2314 family)